MVIVIKHGDRLRGRKERCVVEWETYRMFGPEVITIFRNQFLKSLKLILQVKRKEGGPKINFLDVGYNSRKLGFETQINLSQYLTNLMHKICYTVRFISCLYMFRAHVLIIRRSKLHYTASGIITLKQVSDLKLLKYNSINMNK